MQYWSDYLTCVENWCRVHGNVVCANQNYTIDIIFAFNGHGKDLIDLAKMISSRSKDTIICLKNQLNLSSLLSLILIFYSTNIYLI